MGLGEVDGLITPCPGLFDDALDLHGVAVPVVARRSAPFPLGALASGRAGLVEPSADVRYGKLLILAALGHGAYVDVVLLQGWVGIAEQDSGQLFAVGTLQMLGHCRAVR